jgi:plasmid rolling circle replication initiator protein Rep
MISKNYKILQEQNFQNHKLMNNDIIIKLEKCNFIKESEFVKECCSCLIFSYQENIITSDMRIKLKRANFCKFRFCSSCNWRRNLNINKELLQAFEAIEASTRVFYLFLTLTIKNPKTEDLKTTIVHLNKSFERMSKTKTYKNTILGHFKALEIVGDETPAGEVHPHLHVILIVNSSYFTSRNYISQAKWTDMWQKALRVDYTPIIDVRRIKAKKTKSGKELTALQSAVFEVAKYSVKHSILTEKSDDEFVIIMNQTKRMRFFSTGGILKDSINFIKCDEELINFNAQIELEWQEIEELIYSWKNGNYYLL